MLDGCDSDYSPYSPETCRTYKNLPGGNYTFYVKAKDDYGNIERVPVSRSFTVSMITPTPLSPAPAGGSFGNTLLTGSDINRIAVGSDGSTMYALDSFNSRLYRSDTMGMGWLDITGKVGGGGPWLDLAIAPDDPAMIAVITNGGREIYISADSGATFSNMGLASVIDMGQVATCITISPDYGAPTHDIAVGTRAGTANGKIFLNILSRFPGGWVDISSGASDWSSPGAAGVNVFAIRFSPSYASDGTLLAVVSSAARTYLYAGIRDLGDRTANWNSSGGYPVELCNAGAGTPGTPLKYADISLPADYNNSNIYSRHIFASWSKEHPSQDVYHVVDSQAYRMNLPEPVSSIAYHGTINSGKMLAGAARCKNSSDGCYTVQTYFTPNPMALCPACPVWQPSQKPPTGSGNARVAWSPDGTMAYAGTSGTESALSHSRDNGATWNQ